MKNLVLIVISVLLVCCTTQRKVEDWNRSHPVESAAYCANNFPCTAGDSTIMETTDSTGYRQAMALLNRALTDTRRLNDSLLNALHTDSVCSRYLPVIQSLQCRIRSLQDSLQNLPPKVMSRTITIPVLDSAARRLAEGRAQQLSEAKAAFERDLTKAQKQLKDWRLTAIIGGTVLVVIIGLLILFTLYVNKLK